ncbi:hypothetical protein C7E12_18450 [Stenotrophomonas maltophilia]|nr:hypothetical protein C7E12_18450 [Stenotrophomonas maltophilia]
MLHPVPSALALALAALMAAGPALAETATSAPATAPPSTSGDTEAMEAAGVVSPPEHNGDRTVLAPPPPK